MDSCGTPSGPRSAGIRRRRARSRLALLSAVAALSTPLLVAGPAQAVTNWGCTVVPKAPAYVKTNAAGVKEVNYRIAVTCSAGRSVHIWQERWEEDNDWFDDDDKTGSIDVWRHFPTSGATTNVDIVRALPDEDDDQEEIFHKVRFQVTLSSQATSGVTGWERSPVVQMYNSEGMGPVDRAGR